MKSTKVGQMILLAMTLLAPLPSTGADVLLGTMPLSETGATAIDSNTRFAYVFTIPATAYTLTSVILRLNNYDEFDSPTLGFYTDGGSLPGSLVGSLLTNPAGLGAAAADYTFLPDATVTFAASTRYWMVLGNSGYLAFTHNASATGNPTGAATFDAFMISGNSGASYTGDSNGGAFIFQINATAVPEPSTYAAIFGLCALGFAAWRRRFR